MTTPIVVQQALPFVSTFGPACNLRSHHAFGTVQNGIQGSEDRIHPITGQEIGQSLTAHRRSTHLGQQIGPEILGVPDVERQKVEHAIAQPPAFHELQGRDAQSFLIDLVGGGIVATMSCAANVIVMSPDGHKKGQPVSMEKRPYDCHIRQVAAAVIGIVAYQHVAIPDVLLELGQQGAHCQRHRTDVDWDVLGLGDHASPAVKNGSGEIISLIEQLGSSRLLHDQAHLPGGGLQPIANNGHRSGIQMRQALRIHGYSNLPKDPPPPGTAVATEWWYSRYALQPGRRASLREQAAQVGRRQSGPKRPNM